MSVIHHFFEADGIDDPPGGWIAAADYTPLKQERDELLAALKAVLEYGRGTSGRIILNPPDEQEVFDAITKAEANNDRY